MKVNEIFYSLQGEGARAGEASIFIRLTGCDQSCGFCDTEFESGKELSLDEVWERIKQYPANWIVWTGGEPLLQLTAEIVAFFAAKGFKQSLETNGGHPALSGLDWVVVSPKVAEHVVYRNFPDGVDELRYAWHAGKPDVPRPFAKAKNYYLSPIFYQGLPDKKNLEHCIQLCLNNPQWKLSIQQHKVWNIA